MSYLHWSDSYHKRCDIRSTGIYRIEMDTVSDMELVLLSAPELAAELGARVRRERLRQNLTQQTVADRAGVSRLTVTRMEADGSATLTAFLSVLTALRRVSDLEGILEPRTAVTMEAFLGESEPTRRRGRR